MQPEVCGAARPLMCGGTGNEVCMRAGEGGKTRHQGWQILMLLKVCVMCRSVWTWCQQGFLQPLRYLEPRHWKLLDGQACISGW